MIMLNVHTREMLAASLMEKLLRVYLGMHARQLKLCKLDKDVYTQD